MSSLSVSNTHKTNEIAVSVRDVSLTYSTTIDRRPTFKTRVKALARGKKQTRVVQALKNVNLDVIKTADWIIDLGPEGGDGGGEIIAEGTPEEVANHKKSYTGKYLKPYLK